LYDKIYFGDLDTQVAQLRALADKKAGGTINNIPQISNAKGVKGKNEISKPSSTNRKHSRSESKRQTKTNDKTKIEKVKKKDTSSLRKLLKIGN
jgi:uncharacterized protein YhbP (UPF0306 family)